MQFRIWIESAASIQQFLAEYRALTIPISNWIREYRNVQMGLDLPNEKCHAIYPDSVYFYQIVNKGGRANDAMKMVTDLADKYQVIIEGHVQPMEGKQRDETWLLNWYSHHGFQKVKKEFAWDEQIWHIVRHPRSQGAVDPAASSAV